MADKAAGPEPTITIFLDLSIFSAPNYFLVGATFQPTLGTVTIILSPLIYTGKVFNPLYIGPCYGCPVLILNPAL